MSIRRFQNFQLGALSASRLNEIVDSIARLEARVSQAVPSSERRSDSILVRIKGEGRYTREADCPGRVECCAYPFDEVFLSTSGSGLLGEATCVQYEVPEDAISSDRGAHLLIMEPLPVPRFGQVMAAQLASVTRSERQMVYVATPAGESASVDVYTVLASSGNGTYSVRRASETSGEPETMENLYETSDYYGALLAPQNPCATLTPRTLGAGDRVFGFTSGGRLFTCAPTAWTVECQPCGTNPGGALASTYDASGNEASVAGMMLKGL
jgi:hypothetical protein